MNFSNQLQIIHQVEEVNGFSSFFWQFHIAGAFDGDQFIVDLQGHLGDR